MVVNFASELLRIARATDIVDEALLKEAKRLIERYARDAVQADYVEFMREALVGDRPGLITVWSSTNVPHTDALEEGGGYKNQTCFAFATSTPLWVVDQHDGVLTQESECTDLWSGTSNLPLYESTSPSQGFRTSIMVPGQVAKERTSGVLILESTERLDPTPAAQADLVEIASALAILIRHERSTSSSIEETIQTIRDIEESVHITRLVGTAKPKVFVAFSSRADDEVMASIRTVLDTYCTDAQLSVIAWDEMHTPGDINEQIVGEILDATDGVCYLSEPANGSKEGSYRDNDNVLIEAGMLHVLSRSGTCKGWIPVRERDSPPVPFDFVTQRLVLVPRLREDGHLNKRNFELDLRNKLEALLGT